MEPHSESATRGCSMKKDVLRNFAKVTGKHLGQSLFFNKVAVLTPGTLLKKTEGQTQDSFSHTNFSHFNNFQKANTQTPHILPHRPNIHITPFHTNNNF